MGWEFDVDAPLLRADLPKIAQLEDQVSVTILVNERATEASLIDEPVGRPPIRYPAANANSASDTLTVRNRYWDPPSTIPRSVAIRHRLRAALRGSCSIAASSPAGSTNHVPGDRRARGWRGPGRDARRRVCHAVPHGSANQWTLGDHLRRVPERKVSARIPPRRFQPRRTGASRVRGCLAAHRRRRAWPVQRTFRQHDARPALPAHPVSVRGRRAAGTGWKTRWSARRLRRGSAAEGVSHEHLRRILGPGSRCGVDAHLARMDRRTSPFLPTSGSISSRERSTAKRRFRRRERSGGR